jgi:hypothetical protein
MSKFEKDNHMKRTFFSFFLCCVLFFPLYAQPESISQADFSMSHLSIAGPDEIYIRGIIFEGDTYSAVVKTLDEEGSRWQITELYGEEENLAPANMFLDFVKVIPEGANRLTFSGIIVDGTSYKTSFTIDDSGALLSETPIRQAPMPEGVIEEKLGSFKDLILEAEKEKYEKKIASLMRESEEKTETIDFLREESSRQLQQKEGLISSLSKENDTLSEDLAAAEQQIEELREQLAAAEETSGGLDENDENGAEIRELQQKLDEAIAERDKLAESASAADSAGAGDDRNGSRIDDFTYTETLLEGFAQSVPQLGYWNVIGNTATQTDEDQYFAKLVLPIKQQTRPTLFTFKTRSRGFGWVGTGMHIFATDNHAFKGYGYGNSLLVWLTRDPDYYGSADTRLQLYRSDNAVQMEMVLDAIIEEPMTEYLDVAILYEPEAEYITISVNGIEKLRYKTWFGLDTGLEIALRSLGGYADFTDLKVMTTE